MFYLDHPLKWNLRIFKNFIIYLLIFLLKSSWFTMLCLSLLYSRVTQLCTYIHSFLNIFFHYGLSQEIGCSYLWYTVGPCCLSILNVIVCIYQPQTPTPSLSPLPLGDHKSVLYVCESICFVYKFICVIFLDSKYKWYHMVFVFLCLAYFTKYDHL